MMNRTSAALCLALAMGSTPLTASAASFDTNLIVNGDAEAAPGGTGGVVAVPAFTTSEGEFTTVRYDTGGGYPDPATPGVVAGGLNFFSGGNAAFSSGVQRIDVAALAAALDSGMSSFSLSALLGGFATQDDFAVLRVSFLDASLATLGAADIGPVTATDRANITAFQARSVGGFVPTGTRAIDVALDLTRRQGTANDGYADNLSLILTQGAPTDSAVPEPATWALMILGFGMVGAAVRRKPASTTIRFA